MGLFSRSKTDNIPVVKALADQSFLTLIGNLRSLVEQLSSMAEGEARSEAETEQALTEDQAPEAAENLSELLETGKLADELIKRRQLAGVDVPEAPDELEPDEELAVAAAGRLEKSLGAPGLAKAVGRSIR